MTEDEVREWVKNIEQIQGDPEAAHSEEDGLHLFFIEYVRDEAPEPFSTLAKIILTTEDLDFPRWCA